jgi:glucose-1-phosphate adenylyltransferase, GlgD subunit
MKAIGIILAGGNNEKLDALTSNRAAAAMPIGGCYRALDFTLSNMSNSGVNKVSVITQYNSRSLHDHLSSAKWWNLGRKYGGLFVFSPYLSNNNSFWFRGTADAIYQNLSYLTRSNEPYVIIAPGNSIYKMDYEEALDFHIENQADITIVSKKLYEENLHEYGVMQVDENNRLIDFEEKPIEPQSNLVSLGIYIISRTLLINLLESILPQGRYNLVEDIIIRYRKKLKIMSYEFNGYWKNINCVKSYFDANMDFLNKDIRYMFTKKYPFIETKPKDEPPTKYNVGAKIKDSLIGIGSILNGYVEHSVLFNKVYTGENTSIKNSIIMNKSYIGNNCIVENAILDKEVILSDGKKIIGTCEKPIIISKSTVV